MTSPNNRANMETKMPTTKKTPGKSSQGGSKAPTSEAGKQGNKTTASKDSGRAKDKS